jgi:flagellar biosynthesis/type III secretory pathway M-ring protein FliF/YscJ
MAELEFDPTEDLDHDYDDDNLDDHETDEEEESSQKSGFFSRQRIIILSIIIGSVLLISSLFFILRISSDKKNSNSSPYSSNKNYVKQKKEKTTKKKKIKYEKLYDVSEEQITAVLKQLSFANIPFSTIQKGKIFTVLVDKNQLEKSRNLLAIKGLPGGAAKGYALLDQSQTLGVTEFDKRIRFLRALSGELEKAIIQFNAIENCKVQIVLPEQRLFAVTQPPVTASILVRKAPNAEITDELVLGIIKLISNAVENLQPENVSVIDTDGMVLSDGLFERLAGKATAKANSELELAPIEEIVKQTEEEEQEQKLEKKEQKELIKKPQPIVPNFDEMKNWYKVKTKLEKSLQKKAIRQLIGVLPAGSFKLSIISTIGPLGENGDILDIKRLTISIVVDNANEDIYLDQALKTQIFSTIAGAIGYVKGRDHIILSKADFTLLSEEDKKQLQKIKRYAFILKTANYLLYIIVPILAFFILLRVLRKIRKKSATIESPSKIINENTERETDFLDLKEELNEDKKMDKIRVIADNNPQLLANLMEDWLKNEKEEVVI